MFVVMGYEANRYDAGFVVIDDKSPWGEFAATFEGQSEDTRSKAQELADRLNGRSRFSIRGKT